MSFYSSSSLGMTFFPVCLFFPIFPCFMNTKAIFIIVFFTFHAYSRIRYLMSRRIWRVGDHASPKYNIWPMDQFELKTMENKQRLGSSLSSSICLKAGHKFSKVSISPLYQEVNHLETTLDSISLEMASRGIYISNINTGFYLYCWKPKTTVLLPQIYCLLKMLHELEF